MTHRPAFLPDERADRNHASDGISRFGAYLAQHRDVFAPFGDDDPPTDDPVEYALAAWHIASPSIMAPGYVSWHPRIQSTGAHWDDDHRAALAVEIAVPAPSWLTAALITRCQEWAVDSWPESVSEPWDNDRLTVLTTVTIRVPLEARRLPEACYRRGIPCTDTAKRAVIMLCIEVNTELDSVLAALDTPTGRISDHPCLS